MNREIKFRAWDKINKAWCFYTNADCMNHLNDEKVQIVEFTGLKDKNGKEIFEGDFVQIKDDRIYEISWNKCGFYLKTKKIINDEVYYNTMFTNKNSNKFYGVVIGNIFENPVIFNYT